MKKPHLVTVIVVFVGVGLWGYLYYLDYDYDAEHISLYATTTDIRDTELVWAAGGGDLGSREGVLDLSPESNLIPVSLIQYCNTHGPANYDEYVMCEDFKHISL